MAIEVMTPAYCGHDLHRIQFIMFAFSGVISIVMESLARVNRLEAESTKEGILECKTLASFIVFH